MNDKTKRIKTAKLHLNLYPDLMQAVRKAAAADGRTVTNWIERAIAVALGRKG